MDKRMMQQMQQMQQKMVKAQEELGNTNVTGSAGGAVTVTMNGHFEVKAIKIAREAVDPEDVETLETLILSACKDATEKARQLAEQKMGPFTSGLKGLGF